VRLSLRGKLIAIVATAAAALIVLVAASLAISRRTEQELAQIQELHLPKLRLGPQLDGEFERLKRAFQDGVAAHDLDAINATRAIEDKFLDDLERARGALTPGQIAALHSAIDDYYVTALDVSRRLIAGETGERLVDGMGAMQAKQARAADLLSRATTFDPAQLTAAFAAARQAEVNGGRIRLAVSLFCLAGLVVLSWLISRGVIRTVGELTEGLRRFGRSDFARPITLSGAADELTEVARQANQMAENLQALARERDQNDWVRDALGGLAQETRGELPPDELARRAVRFLARHLGAPAAALYYLDGDRELRLLGQYGGAREGRGAAAAFPLGSGLVGQAALSEEITVIADPPPNYHRIQSGLGEGEPKTIVLVPLSQLGQPRGVLELALFGPWSARAAEAVTRVRENLVIAIEVALARVATRRLLDETQRQAERLTQQEEELRSANEEMAAQQGELQEINQALTQQTTQLESQREVLERNNADLEDARRRLEQKATELSTVSAYKSQFLANMSHELRTPLNSMLLLSNLLAENEDGNLKAKQIEFAKTIHTAGRDLLGLINQVLDLAKIEAGKHEIHRAPVSIHRLVDNAQKIFAPLADEKGIRFVTEASPDLPDSLESDGQRVEQILRNLLGNAVKFTTRGEVSLRVTRPAPGTRLQRPDMAAERTVVFAVSDTGVGISPADQERIFVPFEQVDSAIDRRYGGTGLGLSISRELADLLGGELRVESALGRGSTFRLYLPERLPVADAPAEGPGPRVPTVTAGAMLAVETSAANSAGGGNRLLVIEDDQLFAAAFVDLARKQGFECLRAGDAVTGLRLARERRPIGIVLDVRLPDGDGWQVMEALRADPATASIPVHFVSAVHGAERGMALGAVGYLAKPASRDDLLRVIESLTTFSPEASNRVLVVEDDVVTGDSVTKLLLGEKLEVHRAMNAGEALAALERQRFGCMILDLSLPDMDGLELLDQLRSRYGARMPSVLVYTARALSRSEARAVEALSEAVVLKDGSSAERLVEEVRLFLRRLYEPRGPAVAERPLGNLKLAGRKILLADDDMRTVYALSATLRAKGMEVFVADTGRAAVELLDRRPDIDAVLMDVMMPEMDGLEATRAIRKDPRFGGLPILALTAKAMKDDAKRCIEAGATAYLPKPTDASRLLTVLSGLLVESGDRDG
jgi:signal transduction histidine kinase/DNA-binding response OmpR family regulator